MIWVKFCVQNSAQTEQGSWVKVSAAPACEKRLLSLWSELERTFSMKGLLRATKNKKKWKVRLSDFTKNLKWKLTDDQIVVEELLAAEAILADAAALLRALVNADVVVVVALCPRQADLRVIALGIVHRVIGHAPAEAVRRLGGPWEAQIE